MAATTKPNKRKFTKQQTKARMDSERKAEIIVNGYFKLIKLCRRAGIDIQP